MLHRRVWQLLLQLPLGASPGQLAELQQFLAGQTDPVPEGVSAGLLIRQQQAAANAEAWAGPVCAWLRQHPGS